MLDNSKLPREPDGTLGSPSHCDFWRISPEGYFYTRRGFKEDDGDLKEVQPGKAFSTSMPIWRIGEIVLQVAYVAKALNATDANLIGEFGWSGLTGRELVSIENPWSLSMKRVAHQDKFRIWQAMAVGSIPDALPEVLQAILGPLFELFDFWQLPKRLVETELRKLMAHSFPA
jgi:hypothetical protein